MEKPKFNIGDEVFFVRSSCSYGTKVPCTICFGKRKVTVILGNDEHIESECGYCSPGMEPPSGYSTTWMPHASVEAGAITGVRRDYGGWKYDVGGYTVCQYELFTTREEATPVMEAKLNEETEREQAYERDHFVNATKKQIWSTGYHRGQIASHERSINWHKMRLCMIKDRKPSSPAAKGDKG